MRSGQIRLPPTSLHVAEKAGDTPSPEHSIPSGSYHSLVTSRGAVALAGTIAVVRLLYPPTHLPTCPPHPYPLVLLITLTHHSFPRSVNPEHSNSHSTPRTLCFSTRLGSQLVHGSNRHCPPPPTHQTIPPSLPIQRPVQIKRGRNQRQVAEGLRRVAQLLSRPGYLLRKHSHVVPKAEHVLKDADPLPQVLFVVRSRLYRVSIPYPTVPVSPTRVNASTSLAPALVPVFRPCFLAGLPECAHAKRPLAPAHSIVALC
jgi:hypothetical protein